MPLKHADHNVLSWATDVDDKTLEQAGNVAKLPFIHGHVALMPDAHFGYGSTVGSVIATKGAIIPSAIGVDIGCGMIAVETSLTSHALPDNLGPLHGRIRQAVPAGMGKGHARDWSGPEWDQHLTHWPKSVGFQKVLTEKQVAKAHDQFGSLGGGNHFVEVCLDERDVMWVVLHSGSRGIGNELANIHIDGAKNRMKAWFVDGWLPDKDLAYLVEGTPEFDAYIAAMLWSQEYALGNRETMMDAVLIELGEFLDFPRHDGSEAPLGVEHVLEVDRINCHHNYTERENHNGTNVWLTRKGAIRARVGDRGVIPGSMGAASFIVSGLGNKASYDSASHGAGRRLGRKAAVRSLDLETFKSQMEGKVWNDRDAQALLDEDPRAYKDIDEVMENQKDLVVIEHRLHQVLNYKGVA